MKLSSAAIFLLFLFSSLSNVTANFTGKYKDKKEGKDKKKRKDKTTTFSPSDDDDVELVVRYRNDKGRDDLKLEANDGRVENDIGRFKVVTLNTKRFKIDKIAKDPNIEYVAESHIYHALPHTRGGQALEERHLVENFPYGIELVQADQLGQGSSPVTVCVVDTGYGLGHPDLPNISHGVKGFSPYGTNERWDVDGHSHGTHCAGTIGAIGNNLSVNPDPDKLLFSLARVCRIVDQDQL